MSHPRERFLATDWLPSFELVEWPRLEEARTDHATALAALEDAEPLPGRVRERFAAEDAEAKAQVLAAAREGAADVEPQLTSAGRREAELAIADEEVDKAKTTLRVVVERIVAELGQHLDEPQASFFALVPSDPAAVIQSPRREQLERDRMVLGQLRDVVGPLEGGANTLAALAVWAGEDSRSALYRAVDRQVQAAR
jgi:hypothetical protein